MPQSRENRAKFNTTNFEYVYIAYEVQPFDIDEYVQNPPMVKKLYEDMRIARMASTTLQSQLKEANEGFRDLELHSREFDYRLDEKQKEVDRLREEKLALSTELHSSKNTIEQLKENKHQLEIQKREMEIELRAFNEKFAKSRRAYFLEYIVSLAAAIVLGFGVNIITSTPYDWKGWVIAGVSVILAIIAFFMHERGTNG